MNYLKINKNDLSEIISESVKRILNEMGDLTHQQLINMFGSDNDVWNLAAETERKEKMMDDIWVALKQLSKGENPRHHIYDFKDVCDLFSEKFGFNHVGYDEKNEAQIFKNKDGYELEIYPKCFYPKLGKFQLENYHISSTK